jgi:F-type H+-transporting ATPase subunit k
MFSAGKLYQCTDLTSFVRTVFGRVIKNEYLALGTYAVVGGILALTSGGKKETKPAPGKTTLEKIKEAVPINAGSRCVLVAHYAFGMV